MKSKNFWIVIAVLLLIGLIGHVVITHVQADKVSSDVLTIVPIEDEGMAPMSGPVTVAELE